MKSIQNHLTRHLGAGLAIIIALSGGLLVWIMNQQLNQRFDQTVLHRARALMALTKKVEGVIEMEFSEDFMPDFLQPEGPEFYQIKFLKGQILERSYSLLDRTLPAIEKDLAPQYSDIVLDPGGRCRMVQIIFTPEDETQDVDGRPARNLNDKNLLILSYAQNRDSFDQFVWLIEISVLFAFLLIGVMTLILVRKVLVTGLSPLEDLRSQVSQLDPQSLDKQIQLAKEPEEIALVVSQLNDMLATLRSAMQREQAFTANVAHELRTPIAELRSMAQVAESMDSEDEEITLFFQDVLEISIEMEGLVNNLLALARCDNRTLQINREAMDLVAAIQKNIRKRERMGHKKVIQFHGPQNLIIDSDENLWDSILTNVIGNAIDHGSPGYPIKIILEADGDRHSLTVQNRVDQLQGSDMEHIFVRFWQKDQARTGGNHAGLGLSLIKSLSRLLEVDVQAQCCDKTFQLKLQWQKEVHHATHSHR